MCKQSFRIYERMIRLMENEIKQPGLYRSELEHDACGIGAIVSINGIKTHQTVSDALSIVENLEHRAGKDAEGKTGDGVGILLQISHKFFKKAVKPLGIELGDERDEADGPQAEGKQRRDQNPAADVDIVLFLRFSAALVKAERTGLGIVFKILAHLSVLLFLARSRGALALKVDDLRLFTCLFVQHIERIELGF